MTDPISDLLTRIRNAQRARHKTLTVPASTIKSAIVRLLVQSGYLAGFRIAPVSVGHAIEIDLKYGRDGKGAITGIERVSRPGRRVYCGKAEIPTVLNGLGVALVSTPKGVMTGSDCNRSGVGGEILCNIW